MFSTLSHVSIAQHRWRSKPVASHSHVYFSHKTSSALTPFPFLAQMPASLTYSGAVLGQLGHFYIHSISRPASTQPPSLIFPILNRVAPNLDFLISLSRSHCHSNSRPSTAVLYCWHPNIHVLSPPSSEFPSVLPLEGAGFPVALHAQPSPLSKILPGFSQSLPLYVLWQWQVVSHATVVLSYLNLSWVLPDFTKSLPLFYCAKGKSRRGHSHPILSWFHGITNPIIFSLR